jgi:hypothetical protein
MLLLERGVLGMVVAVPVVVAAVAVVFVEEVAAVTIQAGWKRV